MRAVRRSKTRDPSVVTSSQTAELAKQDSDKEDALNKLGDQIVSDEHPTFARHVAKKKEPVIVSAANVGNVIAGIPYLIEDALTAMMTPGRDSGKPHGDSRMTAMMQTIADKTVPAKLESIEFEIHVRQTPSKIASSPGYLFKVTEALLDTDEVLEPVAHMVKTEADKVTEVSLK